MADPLRKDEAISTADLIGRKEKPQLVRDDRERDIENRVENREEIREGEARNASPNATANINQPSPLFAEAEVGDYRSRWSSVQAAFVDEPRKAVEEADSLVAQLMQKLAQGFSTERERLEKHWDSGQNVSTEDLRVALQRYRSFFDRLLKV